MIAAVAKMVGIAAHKKSALNRRSGADMMRAQRWYGKALKKPRALNYLVSRWFVATRRRERAAFAFRHARIDAGCLLRLRPVDDRVKKIRRRCSVISLVAHIGHVS